MLFRTLLKVENVIDRKVTLEVFLDKFQTKFELCALNFSTDIDVDILKSDICELCGSVDTF